MNSKLSSDNRKQLIKQYQTNRPKQNTQIDFISNITKRITSDTNLDISQDNNLRTGFTPPNRSLRYRELIPQETPINEDFNSNMREFIDNLNFEEITKINSTDLGNKLLMAYFKDRHNNNYNLTNDINLSNISDINSRYIAYKNTIKGCKQIYSQISSTITRENVLITNMNLEEFKNFVYSQIRDSISTIRKIELNPSDDINRYYSSRLQGYQSLRFVDLENLNSTIDGFKILKIYLTKLINTNMPDENSITSHLPIKNTTYDELKKTKLGIYRLLNYFADSR